MHYRILSLIGSLPLVLGACSGSSTGDSGAYTVGGTISGMSGTGLVLQINGGNDMLPTANGSFTFPQALASGTTYNVTVQTHPSYPAQACTAANGSGTVGSANVTSATVTCSSLPVPVVQADANVRSATVTWNQVAQAMRYNLLVSSVRNCDIANYTGCRDGALLANVAPPRSIASLRNGQAYFFRVESVYANGTRGLSNESGARPDALAFGGAAPVDGSPVDAVATSADGTVYIAGSFTQAGIASGSAAPLDAATGRVAVPDFPIVNGPVLAVATDGKGGWYLGGAFDRVGGAARNNLAHVLASGALDPDWNPNTGEHKWNEQVSALAVSSTGIVYVGGTFSTAGSVTRNNLAAVDASGNVTPWNPNADQRVLALAVADGTVYVGGDFTSINGVPRSRLAAVDVSGAVTSWNPAPSVAGRIPSAVFALMLSGNTLYVGGNFNSIGGVARNNLAAFTAGGAITSWNPDSDHQVYALAASGGTVYAGGNFNVMGGLARNHLAAIDLSGMVTAWNPGADSSVSALAISGNIVYAAGFFTTAGGVARNHLAAVDTSGAATPWNPNADLDVAALGVSGNTVYVGGNFRMLGGVTRNHLAAVDAGGVLTPWNPDASLRALALAVSGGTVYAGGYFTSVGGEQRSHLAAIDLNGAVTSWSPEVGSSATVPPVFNPVYALAVSGSTVYVGGDFTAINGITRNHLAAVDTSGAVTSWNPGANQRVSALAESGGTVYAGGLFTIMGGMARNYLAAVDVGGAVTPWNPAAGGRVNALAVSGSSIYVGGAFGNVGGIGRNNLAAVNTSGLVAPWNPNADTEVFALAVSGSTMYVGGNFNAIGGVTRNGLAGVDASGAVTSWNPDARDPGGVDRVVTLAVSGTVVYAGGVFNMIGNTVRSGFAEIQATGTGELVP